MWIVARVKDGLTQYYLPDRGKWTLNYLKAVLVGTYDNRYVALCVAAHLGACLVRTSDAICTRVDP